MGRDLLERAARLLLEKETLTEAELVQFRPAAGGAFTTVKRVTLTDPYGYFDTPVAFPSGGQVRITWSYPHGATIHSRTVSITIR